MAQYAYLWRSIEIDVTPYLPADTISHGFDNIADAQGFSPALLDGYLRAAGQVSRLALGDKQAAPTSVTYRVPNVESQMRYVEGAPFGSRGGVVATHIFPADGTFVFHATMVRTISGELFGNTSIAMAGKNELLEISIDGERAAVLEINPRSPLIEGLLKCVAQLPAGEDTERDLEAEEEPVREVTSVLIDGALVRSGFEVPDSHDFFVFLQQELPALLERWRAHKAQQG